MMASVTIEAELDGEFYGDPGNPGAPRFRLEVDVDRQHGDHGDVLVPVSVLGAVQIDTGRQYSGNEFHDRAAPKSIRRVLDRLAEQLADGAFDDVPEAA